MYTYIWSHMIKLWKKIMGFVFIWVVSEWWYVVDPAWWWDRFYFLSHKNISILQLILNTFFLKMMFHQTIQVRPLIKNPYWWDFSFITGVEYSKGVLHLDFGHCILIYTAKSQNHENENSIADILSRSCGVKSCPQKVSRTVTEFTDINVLLCCKSFRTVEAPCATFLLFNKHVFGT